MYAVRYIRTAIGAEPVAVLDTARFTEETEAQSFATAVGRFAHVLSAVVVETE